MVVRPSFAIEEKTIFSTKFNRLFRPCNTSNTMFLAKSLYKIQKIKLFNFIHTTIEQILTMIVRKPLKVEICKSIAEGLLHVLLLI